MIITLVGRQIGISIYIQALNGRRNDCYGEFHILRPQTSAGVLKALFTGCNEVLMIYVVKVLTHLPRIQIVMEVVVAVEVGVVVGVVVGVQGGGLHVNGIQVVTV